MIEKLRSLLKDSLIYGLERYLTTFSSVVLIPVYTRIFTPAEYGTVELFLLFTAVIGSLAVLGMDSSLAFHYFDVSKEDERPLLVSTNLLFRLAVICVITAIVVPLSNPLAQMLGSSAKSGRYLALALLFLPVSAAVNFSLDLLRLRHRPAAFSTIALGNTALTIITSLYLVVSLRIGLEGVFLAPLVAGVFFSATGLWMNRDMYLPQLSWPGFRSMLAYGLPLVPASISLWLMNFSDRFFLSTFASLYEVGLYAIGYKLSMLLSLITAAFQLAWGPFALSIKDDSDAKAVYARVLTYYFVVTTTAAVCLSLFSRNLLLLFTTPAYSDGSRAVPFLAFSIIFTGAYYIVAIGVNVMRRTSFISVTTAIAAASSFVLNLLLIPSFGMTGAAVANMTANFVSAALLYRISQRYFPVDYELRKIALVIGLCSASMAAGAALHSFVLRVVIVVSYPMILLSFRVIGRDEISGIRSLLASILPRTEKRLS